MGWPSTDVSDHLDDVLVEHHRSQKEAYERYHQPFREPPDCSNIVDLLNACLTSAAGSSTTDPSAGRQLDNCDGTTCPTKAHHPFPLQLVGERVRNLGSRRARIAHREKVAATSSSYSAR